MGDEEDLENEKVIKYDSSGSIDIDGLCQRPTGQNAREADCRVR
mgnify:CR=1